MVREAASRWRRVVVVMLAIAALAYLTATLFLVVRQRSFIYRPRAFAPKTPADFAAPFESLRIPTPHGAELEAWWLRHPGENARPTIVYCHGNAADLSSLAEVSSIFYSWGWNALLFDYSGYGKSSPATNGFSEELLLADAQAAYDFAKAQVPETSILVWGHSLGSSVAARLAAQNSPAGLILEGAFPNLLSMARRRYPWAPIFSWMLFDHFETETYVLRRAYPLLVMHGEGDRVIPVALGRKVYETAAEPKQWLLVPEIGHKDFPSVSARYRSFFTELAASWTGLPQSPLASETKPR
ncbi:MAG: alpha/beta hydrolase [Deltaproteobacteria bacterium]|nr:alpha/beta hydrolase [Deltaproteobacteria bacterium]